MTAADLRQLLRVRYPATTHALVFEVRDAAGFSAQASADALALGLYPSRGLLLSGHEIKVSRGDWLKEIRKPHKAEAFVRFCDEWWIVAADDSIVKPDELPAPWGLLIVSPHGQGLRIAKKAPKLKPKSLDRTFVAALLKRALHQSLGGEEVKQIREEERRKALIDVNARLRERYPEERVRRIRREVSELTGALDRLAREEGL